MRPSAVLQDLEGLRELVEQEPGFDLGEWAFVVDDQAQRTANDLEVAVDLADSAAVLERGGVDQEDGVEQTERFAIDGVILLEEERELLS